MTEPCLDTDALVSVASALEWAVPARLDHLVACERCRARLQELAGFQRELTAASPLVELDPATATARAVVGTLPPPPAGERMLAPTPAGGARRLPAAPLVAAATFLIAGATALLATTLLAGSPPIPLALSVAALAGLASIAPSPRFWRQRV